MTPTGASLKCMAINVRCKRTPRSITYIVDYLLRRQGLTLEETASVIAAPFWSTIDPKERCRSDNS